MTLSVDVVVPVYGNWTMTRRCLSTLTSQTSTIRIIVVDDASPDDTLERVSAEFPVVDVVALAHNSGFAAACNAGIAAGTAEIVVLVNNDIEADPRMIEALVEPFVNDGRLGSSTPLLYRPDGTIDAFGLTCDVTLSGFVRDAGRAVLLPDGDDHRLIGPYGAVAAYRRRALDTVGTFDEGIVMYGEELDLAVRLDIAGWATVAERAATGVHLGGATAGRGSASQRRKAGFGRGYLLRVYRVLVGRHAVRALVTELAVCVADAALSRDLASFSGRIAGWRSARGTRRPRIPSPSMDRSIGFVESMRLRAGSRRGAARRRS